MKKIIFLAIILGTVFTFSNCKKKDDSLLNTPKPNPLPASTNITVSLKKLSTIPESVNCVGLSVELHSNALYTAKVKSAISTGTATAGTATIPSVPNGKYYLIAWKDIDASNSYTNGDLFGFVEAPVILNGISKSYTIDVYVLKE